MEELGALGSRLTFSGLSTGLDTGALIEALIQVERRPLVLLQNSRAAVDARRTALQTFNSRLLELRDGARSLDNRIDSLSSPSFSEEFLAFRAESSDASVVEAEVSADAVPGTVRLRVDQLATSARRVSLGFADPNAPIENRRRNFTIDYGDGERLVVRVPRNSSLNELRELINSDPDNPGDFRADVLYDGSGYRLVVSGLEAGAANNVSVSTNLDGPGGGVFLDDSAGQDALDASFQYLGVSVTRPSNDVADLIPGVTLRLAGTSTEEIEIDVSRDDEAITAKLQGLVDAYNSVRDFSIDQSTTNANERGGPLLGDSLVRVVERRLQGVLFRSYSFTDNSFSTASQLGLRFDASGRLSLDADQLDAALTQDARAVRELLSGDDATDGVASALARELEPLLRAGDGILAQRDGFIEDEIERIDRQILRFEDRLLAREEFLVRRFSALESLVSTLQAQSGFLGGGGA